MSKVRRTVVITGATKGLGRELSFAFAADGYEVIGLYRSDVAAADQIKAEFASRGLPGRFIHQDIVAEGAWVEFEEAIAASNADHIIFISNASAPFAPRPLHLIDGDELSQLLLVNAVGMLNVLKRLLPTMVRRRAGLVISILSTALTQKPKGFSAYVAAKAALRGLTDMAETEYGDRGIRFVSYSPGFMETDLTRSWSPHLKASMNLDGELDPAQVASRILAIANESAVETSPEARQMSAPDA